MIKVMTIFGTRPEAIKMAPLIKSIESDERFKSIVTVTAQHRQMLDQVMNIFDIHADFDLNIMKEGQTLADITISVLKELDKVLYTCKPDIILVHGDTSTTFAASVAAFYHKIKVGHVEAGLRTWDKYSPFPEEMNRQLTDVIADYYFAPTEQSKLNLLEENHPEDRIFVTGNTAIDAMKYTIREDYEDKLLNACKEKRIILVTMHRRENIGQPMKQVFEAIKQLVSEFEDIEVIFPMHKNPEIRDLARTVLSGSPKIHLIEPLDVIDFQNYANNSYLILSDSGGIQEEAPSLGVPVLVLRDTTERPEGIQAGTLLLVGTDKKEVYEKTREILLNPSIHEKLSKTANPYGDGNASERILDILAREIYDN